MAVNSFCQSPGCQIHTFVIHIGMRGNHSNENIEATKAELAEFLTHEPEDATKLKKHFEEFLKILLGRHTGVLVCKHGQSFFIIISVYDGKNMVIEAVHHSLNRLRSQAARIVGQHLTEREEIPSLGLPKVLEEFVKDFIPTNDKCIGGKKSTAS